MFHIFLHLLIPVLIASVFFPKQRLKISLILIATMLVDLDHLLATPIYDPLRCSIGFHPLHQYWAIGGYFVLLFFKTMRVPGLGLIIHMVLDFIDCYL